MDTVKCIRERRSVRQYTDQNIAEEDLRDIVDTARFAPSWKNTQITRYTFIRDKELAQNVADNCVMNFEHNMQIIKECNVLAVITYISGRSGFERDGSYSTSKKDGWEMFDAGIATQTFCLTCHQKGIGTVIMGIFDENEVIKTVGIPDGQKVAALVAMGYSSVAPSQPKRKEPDELITLK